MASFGKIEGVEGWSRRSGYSVRAAIYDAWHKEVSYSNRRKGDTAAPALWKLHTFDERLRRFKRRREGDSLDEGKSKVSDPTVEGFQCYN